MGSPRILICGGRDFSNRDLLISTLDKIVSDREWISLPDEYGNWLPDVVIIQGGAKGADQLAFDYAVVNWLSMEEYKADWNKYGKSAGPIRNQQMLDEGKPDLVVAFPTEKSVGTWDMIRRARKANVEVIIVNGKET